MFTFRRLLVKTFTAANIPAQFCFSATKAKQPTLSSQFTQLNTPQGEKPVIQSTGRAWKAIELRLKSNEDLHRLWYVCLKQKNLLLADKVLHTRYNRSFKNKHRIGKVELTMKRILAVMKERQIVRDNYRRQLEEQYVQKKKQEMEESAKKEDIPDVPDLSWRLMKEKLRDLRKGIDNTNYLERMKKYEEQKQKKKEMLREKFKTPIPEFTSFFEKELESGTIKPSQEQILRSHIKNWRQLSFKHRRIVLGFLNARRAKDARTQFIKELKLLGQKIANQQSKSQFTSN